MSIFCLGLNHKSAPVEIRERFVIPEKKLSAALQEVRALPGVHEAVILSTCNRMEIYAVTENRKDGVRLLRDYLQSHFQLSSRERELFYLHEELEVARHLFRVASGLDSMVLGETEVFGQVKKAYHAAHSERTTARNLNKLFQWSFRVGKTVRSGTHITKGSTSVGSVAVDLAEKIFGDLRHCQVMIIGAGEMSRRTAKSLLSRGASSIFVSNRSHDRAVELAREMDGVAIRFDDWVQAIPEVDIMITSTAAPHTFIHVDKIEEAMRLRRGRPLFVIDIAVPRDVDPDINDIDSVYLYDIDALETIAAEGRRKREKQIHLCEGLIEEQLEDWDFAAGTGTGDSQKDDPGEEEKDLRDLSPAHD